MKLPSTSPHRRFRAGPTTETLTAASDEIARASSGYEPGGLRVRWDRLADGGEELVALTEKLRSLGEGDRRRWERLVEQAADRQGVFDEVRERERLEADVRAMRREAHRRPISRTDEKGLLAAIADDLATGHLWADDTALLVLTVAQFQRGEAFQGGDARIRTGADGATELVFRRGWGPLPADVDPEGVLSGWSRALEHLCASGWLESSSAGNEIAVRLGARTRDLLEQA